VTQYSFVCEKIEGDYMISTEDLFTTDVYIRNMALES